MLRVPLLRLGVIMDDVVNRLAKEYTEAAAAALANDERVLKVREQAFKQGFLLKVSMEAVIGFIIRSSSVALVKVPSKSVKSRSTSERQPFEISANDRRFLRSLRIADPTATEEEAET